MKIKRTQEHRLWAYGQKMVKAGLEAVTPQALFRKGVRRSGEKMVVQGRVYDLSLYRRIYVAALGKAAPRMTAEASRILGDRLTEGITVCLPGQEVTLSRVMCLPSSHPLPDRRSLRAAKALLELARKAGERDLFLVLISGGGSALASLPVKGLSLRDKITVTERLLRAGADISELNAVRKHLSAIKGGRLAEAAWPAEVANLVVSDVIGNDLSAIASGPTYGDSTTYAGARRVLQKYGIWNSAPARVRTVIEEGLRGMRLETLRKTHKVFRRVKTFVLGDNLAALQAAQRQAGELGFRARILTSADCGEAREAAARYARYLEKRLSGRKNPQPLCFLAGGELTVTVRGKGRGGRNMEFCLAFLNEWLERPGNWIVVSLGTDGRDGTTDAAGARVGPGIIRRARRLGLDAESYLRENDSYGFFKHAGGLIKTGPTGVNVMDMRLFLFGPRP